MFNENIKKAFTEAVKQYMNNGFVFNVETMNGLQGELARVDLVKGTCFIRICLYKNYNYRSNSYTLSVLTTHKDDGEFVGTIWNDDLTTVNSIEI